ncbi:MAG: thioredoxin family protein [Microbacter sp.]
MIFLNNNLNKEMIDIKILGTGCPKCRTLEKMTRDVVEKTGIEATITKVENIVDMMRYNIMVTPALVVNGKVVLKGRIPSMDELKRLITN